MMRNRMMAGAQRVICRYSQDVIIKRSRGGGYDKKSMKYITNGRDDIPAKIAIFKKGSEQGALNAIAHGEDGKEISYNVKIFSNIPLVFTEDSDDQSDVILWDGKEYILVYLDKLNFCNNIWVGYAKSYKCVGTE